MDYLAFANVFANNLAIIYAGAFCAFAGLSRFFPLRGSSVWPFWLYFLVKCSIWAFYDAVFFFGLQGGAWQNSWVVVAAALSVATYAILYITWGATILKIGLVAVLVDSVSGFCTFVVLALSSLLLTGEVSLEYVGYLRLQTPIVAVGEVALFLLLIRFVSPIGRFICNFKFKRERLWTAVLMTVFVLAASTKTKGVDDVVVAYALLACAVLLFIPHILWRGRMAQRQRMSLARARALARAYDDSLRSQVEFLSGSRQLLDELAARIEAADDGANNPSFSEHLVALRTTCDALRFGTYSDNPALDAMLASWEKRFAALGVPVEYRIALLAGTGVQAAFIVQALFEWVYQESGRAPAFEKDRKFVQKDRQFGIRGVGEEAALCADLDKPPCEEPVPSIQNDAGAPSRASSQELAPTALCLRVFHSANQLLIELRLFAWNGSHFPRSRVAERAPSQMLSIREFDEDGKRVIRVIVEEERPWSL